MHGRFPLQGIERWNEVLPYVQHLSLTNRKNIYGRVSRMKEEDFRKYFEQLKTNPPTDF